MNYSKVFVDDSLNGPDCCWRGSRESNRIGNDVDCYIRNGVVPIARRNHTQTNDFFFEVVSFDFGHLLKKILGQPRVPLNSRKYLGRLDVQIFPRLDVSIFQSL